MVPSKDRWGRMELGNIMTQLVSYWAKKGEMTNCSPDYKMVKSVVGS